MNKFFKRLALLLAVLMIVSMMPVQLFADNSVTVEEQSNGTGEASGNSNAVAKIGDTGYESLAEAIAAANGNGTVTLLTATTELVQALLDGQYGSIDGLTIELPTGDYGKLELGRATKYAGSNTKYFVGGFDSTATNYKAFASADEIREYKGQSAWTPNCFYRRALNNVTIKAADGATVTIEKISADAGQIYGKADAPKYDYVLDVEIPDTNKSYYMALAWNNVTFKGINFKSSVNIESSSEKTLIDGLHFEKCNFNSGYTALAAANDANATSKGMGIRFVSWTKTTNNLRNLTVNNCTFEDCSEGVYTNPVYGVSVTNSIFNNINHNAVAIQDDDSAVDHGNVVISDNHFENVGNRIIRFNNVGDGTTITITGNTSVNSGDSDGEIIKATTMPDSVNVNMTSNKWGDVNGKTAVLGNGFKPTSTAVATVGGVEYTTLAEAIAAATRNSTVTLLADTRENVTIDKALTLDLNGFTLNGGTEKGKPALTIITARVTVKDSSAAQTGTIMREDTAENSGVSSHYVIDIQGKNALLTFNSGNVRNNSGNANGSKGASLVRVGNDSDKKAHPVLTIAGGTFTQDNFIVIKVDFGTLHLKGGTVSSKNSYAVENWLNANIKENAVVNGAVSSWTYSGGSNSTLTISGGTVNGDVESVSYDGTAGKKASVSITGGTVNGTLSTKRYDSATEPSKEMATIEVTGGTFTKDPTKYVVEDSTVAKNDDGTFGVAKAYLAKVGENSYYTMDEAFKAQTASGEPIVLLRDYTTGSPFNSGTVARTVDLNGHTWTCTGKDANSAAFEINNANASLTVKNGKIVSSQLVGLIPSAMGGTIKYDNSSLTFENVEMSTTATSGIETNGNNTNDTVTLKNSALNVPNGFGIYFPSSGTLTLDNSTVNAKTMGVQVCAGSLSINEGSAVTVTGDAVPKAEKDGAIQDGAAISIVNRTGYKGLDTVTISGGKFTAKEGNSAIKAYNWVNNTESDFTASEKVAVSGGTFSSAVSADLCAEGLVPVANTDGTYGVKAGKYVAKVGSTKYETLADAIRLAANGKTITLLVDIEANIVIPAGKKNITLDLGGKTLNGGTGNTKATITNYGTITITDSSAEKTGTIKRDDNGTEGETSYYVIRNFGTMTIEQANIINNSGYKKTNPSGSMVGSSLICNGDDDAYSAVLNIKGGTIRQDNFIAIKNGSSATLNVTGGKITSKHSAVQNWCNANITGGELNGQLWTDSWDSNSTGNTVMGGDAKFTGEIVIDITGSIVPKFEITGGTLDVTNWRITTAAANAGAKPAVSGGTFSSAVPEEYCADGFIPTKNADGTYGVKEGKYVAQIGDVKYETLEEAFAAAKNGDTITLLEDCKSDRINLEDKSVTVVLNGKTLTSTAAYGVMFCAKNGNKITIDGTVEGSKLVGTLMITSGTDGHIEVNGGTYESSQYCPIYVNGSVSSENSTVTVKNAIIKATNISSDQDMGCGVYLAGYSTSAFENCTITAPITGIEIRAGKLTLNNCDVTGGNGEVTADANGNGTTVTNAALAISQHTTKKPIDVTIDGGTFNGTAAVYQTDVQGTGSANVKIAVKGGTFNGTISGETDGTIAISGGKFKFKVDDKYFDGNHACSTDMTDGYYTVEGHPIISAGISIGEDMSFRIMVGEGYENGSLKYYYIGVNGRVEGEGTIGTDTKGNSIFRVYNINPQRADLIYVVQYYDADGNAIGAPKEISILEYFERFYNKAAGDGEDLDARKTFIANFLEYCAASMEKSYADFPEETLDDKTWQDRADAVRAMMNRLGLVAKDYEFKGNLGRYYNDNANGVIIERGVVFGSAFKAYYKISREAIDNGYKVFRQGMDVTDKLELVDGAYIIYFELAPYEFKDNLTIIVNNGTTKVCEYTSPLANTLEMLSKSTDISLAKMAKAAFNYFVALQNYNG